MNIWCSSLSQKNGPRASAFCSKFKKSPLSKRWVGGRAMINTETGISSSNIGSVEISPAVGSQVANVEARQELDRLKESLFSDSNGLSGAPINSTLKEFSEKSTALASDSLESLSSQLSSLQESLTTTGISFLDDGSKIIDGVNGAINEMSEKTASLSQSEWSKIMGQIEAASASLNAHIPPEMRSFYFNALDNFGKFGDEISRNPRGYEVLAVVAAGIPILAIWNRTYGGYSGSFSPQKTLEVLRSEDALLIDIRNEFERRQDGVPLLKQGARGKGIVIPFEALPPTVSRKLKNGNKLAFSMLGAKIASADKLQGKTKVIIMDSKGKTGKDVARFARIFGVRNAYYVKGGFTQCRNEGLEIEKSIFYDEGPLALVADSAETFTEETKSLLSSPKNSALILGAVVGTFAITSNLHEVLKYIGVLGLEATVAVRLLTYESFDDAKEDFENLQSGIKRAVNFSNDLIGSLAAFRGKETSKM